MIVLEDLCVKAGTFRLDGICLNAKSGEYLVVLGPSGAGKTVLLETIAGLREPDGGKILIAGKDMAGVPPEVRGTALVYQDYSLFPHLTVTENVAYGLKVRKMGDPEIRKRVDALLAAFRIAGLKDRYPGSLSGGEKQRVAIARALATGPSVLLLDEPFASLDPRARDECMRVMQDLKEGRSITIVQVSHSPDDAYALADRAMILIGGRIAQTGSPDEIFHTPISADAARFVGIENVLTGTVVADGSRSRLSVGNATISLPAAYPPGTVLSVGIPAGCIRVLSDAPPFDDPEMNAISAFLLRVTFSREFATLDLVGPLPLTATLRRYGDDKHIPLPGMNVVAVFRSADIRVF